MAQLWWFRWLQSTAIPTNPMTFGMVSTWESTYYPTLHHQSLDEIAILRCSVWTNPFTNPWGQKLEQMAWWLMAEPMRRSSCLGKPNSTNKILLGAQGLRLLHCFQWKWLTEQTLMASGLKSKSFFCFMSISVMEGYHQETPRIN